jgi:hypothetical protein
VENGSAKIGLPIGVTDQEIGLHVLDSSSSVAAASSSGVLQWMNGTGRFCAAAHRGRPPTPKRRLRHAGNSGEVGGSPVDQNACRPETVGKLIGALEAAGIEFTDGDQPGVLRSLRWSTLS